MSTTYNVYTRTFTPEERIAYAESDEAFTSDEIRRINAILADPVNVHVIVTKSFRENSEETIIIGMTQVDMDERSPMDEAVANTFRDMENAAYDNAVQTATGMYFTAPDTGLGDRLDAGYRAISRRLLEIHRDSNHHERLSLHIWDKNNSCFFGFSNAGALYG